MPSMFDTVLCEFSVEEAEWVAAVLSRELDLYERPAPVLAARDRLRDKTAETKALAAARST